MEQIVAETGGEGVDRGVDAVGYQALAGGKGAPNSVLMSLVKVVRPTGGIGVLDCMLQKILEHRTTTQSKVYCPFQ